MTTAHRPTWRSAMGSENGGYSQIVPSQAYSARSVKGYTQLKERCVSNNNYFSFL